MQQFSVIYSQGSAMLVSDMGNMGVLLGEAWNRQEELNFFLPHFVKYMWEDL